MHGFSACPGSPEEGPQHHVRRAFFDGWEDLQCTFIRTSMRKRGPALECSEHATYRGNKIVMSGRPWRCACCWAVLTCARSIIEVRIRLGPRSYSIAPQGNVSPLNISLSAVLYPTDIPWIVLPPPTFQNSLVRLPIKRIFPPFHAASITMRTERKSAITRPTDPQPIRIAKRLVERDCAGVCGLLIP
jgi:hypothetical protein